MRTHTLYFMITAIILSLLLSGSLSYADSWQTSLPVTQTLYAVLGSSDGDIYAAGANGTLIHWDGGTWDEITSNTSFDLTSLLEFPNIAVLTAGDGGTILLNGGTGWLKFRLTDSHLNALWGLSVTKVYAVGSLGTILAFNGTSWKDATPSSVTNGIELFSIWGSTENNIYVGGENGAMFHYDGTTWSEISSSLSASQDIRAIWGSSGSDIYAAGTDGDILHYNGSAWTAKHMGGLALYALWGSAASDIFAAGAVGNVYHYDGHSWSSLSNNGLFSSNINAIWGSNSGKVYFAGQDGTILIYTRDDTIPPVINASKIAKNNDGTAYISTPITFSFSEKMKASTISSSTVIMKSGSTVVSAQVSLSSDGMTLSVSGDSTFSTPYTITVTGGSNGVKDLAGNALVSDYSVSFTTEAEPTSTGSGGASGCFISSARM